MIGVLHMDNKQKINTEKLVNALKSVLPSKNIALHEPCFNGNEWNYVKECIDTAWVSSVGKYVDKFEKDLAEYTGSKRAIAVVNGTAALHICLILAGVQEDDEVLVSPVTFVATVNAIAYCRAVPHFVDIEKRTLGIDPTKLLEYLQDVAVIKDGKCYNKITNRKIAAVLPMHTFGHPVDLDPLLDICRRYKLTLIEDAAESIGSYYKNKHTGNHGLVSAVSFNGNKTITTGGGGAILTNDEELGKLAKHLTTTAKKPHPWEFYHDHVGYNYRMPNINAALGCAQLEQLDNFITAKRALTTKYENALKNIPGVKLFKEPSFAKSNYWLNAIILDEENINVRDEILKQTNESGIMTRPIWQIMYKLPMYKNAPKMPCDIAESIANRLINIPSSVGL